MLVGLGFEFCASSGAGCAKGVITGAGAILASCCVAVGVALYHDHAANADAVTISMTDATAKTNWRLRLGARVAALSALAQSFSNEGAVLRSCSDVSENSA